MERKCISCTGAFCCVLGFLVAVLLWFAFWYFFDEDAEAVVNDPISGSRM